MGRDENCLPGRIKAVLALINKGEFVAMTARIADAMACEHRPACEVASACERIHKAFLPLSPDA